MVQERENDRRDDTVFVRRRHRKATSQGATNVVSGEITTNTRGAHTDPDARRRWQARLRRQCLTDNNFRKHCTARLCYVVVLATTARPIPHACGHPEMPNQF